MSRVVARGWATVELDRAEGAALDLLGPGQRFVEAPRSEILGARCRIGRGSGESVVLLEPDTEGRLAGYLARHGEGWAATWRIAADVRALTRPGPLGPEALVPSTPTTGPFRLVLPAATIGSMTETTDPTVSVRPAGAGDAEAIAALFTDEGYPSGPSDIVERMTRFASEHSRVLVAEHDGALLGFIALHALPRFEHDDRILRVLALVVDAGARERGVGHRLMAEAERIASELDAAFVEVTAGHHRPEARRLYESLGYDASVAAYLRKKL
jgi:GNAT superfamily N-acetyltransferase